MSLGVPQKSKNRKHPPRPPPRPDISGKKAQNPPQYIFCFKAKETPAGKIQLSWQSFSILAGPGTISTSLSAEYLVQAECQTKWLVHSHWHQSRTLGRNWSPNEAAGISSTWAHGCGLGTMIYCIVIAFISIRPSQNISAQMLSSCYLVSRLLNVINTSYIITSSRFNA